MNDFEFIVSGSESRYRCPWFIADFPSPRIAALGVVDNTIYSYEVATKDQKSEIEQFLSLGRGKSVIVDSTNRRFYELLSEEVLNEELLNLLCSGNCEELSRDNILKRLEHQHRMNFEYSKEISFIASHFHEIDVPGLCKLDDMMLSRILSSDELMIKREDWFYETIWKLIENDRQHFCLNRFIRFEFVSKSSADRFGADGIDCIDLIHRFGQLLVVDVLVIF
jgi:hypothetical protein